jgi:hypothetical protein
MLGYHDAPARRVARADAEVRADHGRGPVAQPGSARIGWRLWLEEHPGTQTRVSGKGTITGLRLQVVGMRVQPWHSCGPAVTNRNVGESQSLIRFLSRYIGRRAARTVPGVRELVRMDALATRDRVHLCRAAIDHDKNRTSD